jgi:hypothetical protein
MLNRLFCAAIKHRDTLKLLRVAAIVAIFAVSLAVPSLVSASDVDGIGP